MHTSPTNRQKIKRLLRILLGRDAPIFVQTRRPREWHGSAANGWVVCPDGLNAETIVYSLGIGLDITFDLSLMDKFGTAVHAFDPTPASLGWLKTQNLPEKFHYHDFGVAGYDGTATFYPPRTSHHASRSMVKRPSAGGDPIEVPVKRLETIRKALGHPRIDLLKMDIEGAEYDVIADMLAASIRPRQLLVEFHHKFPALGLAATKKAVRALASAGYRIFYISPRGEEYSFIRATE